MTDLNRLNTEYTDFIKAELAYLDRTVPLDADGDAEVEFELENATYATLLLAKGINLLNQEDHIKLMQGTQLGSAPLARVIMGRVRMTENIAYRLQVATEIPVDRWLNARAVREETTTQQQTPDEHTAS
jgi:hypothetical protein